MAQLSTLTDKRQFFCKLVSLFGKINFFIFVFSFFFIFFIFIQSSTDGCKPSVDVVFVLDSSERMVGAAEAVRKVLPELVKEFSGSYESLRLGVVTFTDEATDCTIQQQLQSKYHGWRTNYGVRVDLP